MPIPGTDQSRLRTGIHTIAPKIHIWDSDVVATALVNQTSFDYPVGQLTVDTFPNYADVTVGMRYEITRNSGATRVTSGIIRKTPTATTLYIDAKSYGDPGFNELIATSIQNNDTITIYNDWPLWSMLSVIRNQVFYKQWDIPYSDEGSNPAPVVNIGEWQFGQVPTGDTTVSFTMTATVGCWNSKTVSTYAWALPAEAVLTGGATNSDTVTFTLPGGFYLVRCTVQDSGGAIQTAIRPVWVVDSENVPYSDNHAIEITADDQDLQGRNVNLKIYGITDIDRARLKPGLPMAITDGALYNGTALSAGVSRSTYVGYISSVQLKADRVKRWVEVSLESPFGTLAKIPMVNQAISEVASPSNWTEVATGIGTPDFLIFYLLQYHSPNMLALFDYDYPSGLYRHHTYSFNGSSVGDQVKECAALIGGNIGSSSVGTLHLFKNPNFESASFRSGLDTRMIINPGDFVGEIDIPYNYRAPLGQLRVYGWSLDSSDEVVPLGSIAPGWAQGQGVGRSEEQSIVVNDQTDLNAKSGHMWAEQNSPTPEVRLQMDRNFDVFDPARQFNAWWYLDIGSEYNPNESDIDWRALAVRVSRTWSLSDLGTPFKTIEVTFRPETFGLPGQTIPIDQGGAMNQPVNQTFIEDSEYFVDELRSFAIAWDNQGYVGRTVNFWDDKPLYYDMAQPSGVVINDLVYDPASSMVLSGFMEGVLGAYAVGVNGTSLTVYYIEDVLADYPEWQPLKTYTMNDSTCDTSARLALSDSVLNLVGVAWRDRVGTYVAWTTDGSTWSSSAQKVDASSNSDTANDDAPITLIIEGSNTITTGRTTGDKYRVYYTATPDTSFSEVGGQSSTTESDVPCCCWYYDGILYTIKVGQIVNATYWPDYNHDEGAGDAGWTTSIITQTSPTNDVYEFPAQPYMEPMRGSNLVTVYGGSYSQGDATVEIRGTFSHEVTVTGYGFYPESYSVTYGGSGPLGIFSMELRSSADAVLYSDTGTATGSVSNPYVQQEGGSGLSVSGVKYVVYKIENPAIALSYINETTHYGMPVFFIYTTDTSETAYLYKITDYDSSPIWNNITPSGYQIPRYPLSLAFDPTNPGRLGVLARENTTQNLYESTNYGSSYTDRGSITSAMENHIFVEDYVLTYGDDGIYYTEAGLGNLGDNKTNSWANTFGSRDRFLGIALLF